MIVKNKILYILLAILLLLPLPDIVAKDRKDKDDKKDSPDYANVFSNEDLLNGLFEKLSNLEKNGTGKLNIVHIGDSHIQADIFTNTIRQALQNQYGNGGWGFTFPYSLMRTNGPRTVKYISDAVWQNQLNVYPIADVGVGLSGIALFTGSEEFMIQLSVEEEYAFNKIKILYPTKTPQYRVSLTAEPIELSVSTASTAGKGGTTGGYTYHKIKSGESLSTIARKYRTTVSQIKRANGLKSDNIRAGRSLKIPKKGGAVGRTVKSKVSKLKFDTDSVDFVDLANHDYYSSFVCDSTVTGMTIMPDGKNPTYNLNGFVIENDRPGIVYHTIGVNGAKMTDYAKYPLFFNQLPILEPDLIILSFGTNESFGKISATEYMSQLNNFVESIKAKCGENVAILVMTPPPSLFRRGRTNQYVVDYADALMNLQKLPVWDLFSRMGGLNAIRPRGSNVSLIARDKVHYTAKGYQVQGNMFVEDFTNAYMNYKKNQIDFNITETIKDKDEVSNDSKSL